MGIGSSPLHFHGGTRDGRPGCCIRWVGDDGAVVEGGTERTLPRSTVPETVLCCRGCREDGGPECQAWSGLRPCSGPLCTPGVPRRDVGGRWGGGRTPGRRVYWRIRDRARWQHPAHGTRGWSGRCSRIHSHCQHWRTARGTCHIHGICGKDPILALRH